MSEDVVTAVQALVDTWQEAEELGCDWPATVTRQTSLPEAARAISVMNSGRVAASESLARTPSFDDNLRRSQIHRFTAPLFRLAIRPHGDPEQAAQLDSIVIDA